MAARIKQTIKFSATNNKAKYKVKYSLVQKVIVRNKKQSTKYSYSKKITPIKKKKYSYKKKG